MPTADKHSSPGEAIAPPDERLSVTVGLDAFQEGVTTQGGDLVIPGERVLRSLLSAYKQGLPLQIRLSGVTLQKAEVPEELEDYTPYSFYNGTITVDPRSRQVYKRGEAVALPKRCYGVVALLGRSPGRVYSKQQLLDEVWRDNAPQSNKLDTVRLHIHRIREHLGEEAIRTFYKVGYTATK